MLVFIRSVMCVLIDQYWFVVGGVEGQVAFFEYFGVVNP